MLPVLYLTGHEMTMVFLCSSDIDTALVLVVFVSKNEHDALLGDCKVTLVSLGNEVAFCPQGILLALEAICNAQLSNFLFVHQTK